MKRAIGKRVGDKFFRTELQELVQRDRANFFGDNYRLDIVRLCGLNKVGDKVDICLIFLVNRDGDKFQCFGIRLLEKYIGILK